KLDHPDFMKLAVDEAFIGMRAGEGGPFGAIITLEGKIIGRGHNTVLKSSDPTAHAEVNAIRDACRKLESPHLTGAVIYSNFEPCPMCLAAIYWADIRSLIFCKGRKAAEEIGFMDKHLYHELSLKEDQRELRTTRISVPEMEQLMEEWKGMDGKKLY
ncbi:MAG: nucleoside deaminase, partial [Bacteroidota bacterium]|nr:nucleoside deaminase [Bacteroidota bacterium]